MNSNQWATIVSACQHGDTGCISDTIAHPPENLRFNKLMKIAIQHQQWGVVAQLLPVWDWSKSPRIFNIASLAPLAIAQKACEILINSAPPAQARKDCIACVWSCVAHDNVDTLQFFIDQLRTMNVGSLHDLALWEKVGKSTPEIYTTLIRNFNPSADTQAHVFFEAIKYGNWNIVEMISPQTLGQENFLHGLIRSVGYGQCELITQHLPHLSTQNLHTVIKKTVESGFGVNRSRELNVWMNVLTDFTSLGAVVEDLLKCAIASDNLAAVRQLAPHYTPQDTQEVRPHPLGWVVNNLAGSFDPDHSMDMLHALLPRYRPDHRLLLHTVNLAVLRRGGVTMSHLDALRAYATDPEIDIIALKIAIANTNTSSVKHLLATISDADFLQAVHEVKDSVGPLEKLHGWQRLEPWVQPKILQLALAEHTQNTRAVKRKI